MSKPRAKNRLHAKSVDRIAIVDRPAVPDAQIVVFKRRSGEPILPIVSLDKSWSDKEAQARVIAWAGGQSNLDLEKYSKAFVYVDKKDAKNPEAYKLQYADIIDGKLQAVPKGIFAVVKSLTSRGEDKISMEDRKTALSHCKNYYEKMDADFPEITVKVLEKGLWYADFMTAFAFKGTQAAVDALEDEIWDAIYTNDGNQKKTIKKAFADFTIVVRDVLGKLVKEKAIDDGAKLTKEDIVRSFNRGMAISAMSETLAYFRTNIAYLIMAYSSLEDPDGTINEVVASCQKRILNNITDIVANKRKSGEQLEKVGRSISKENLSKLMEAVSIIQGMVDATDSHTDTKHAKEAGNMENEKLEQMLKDFGSVSVSVKNITDIMTAKGYFLTEEEITKARSDKETADEKSDLEKRAETLGLAKDATEEAIVKGETEVKEKADVKAKADLEKKDKEEADKVETEKKDKADLLDRLDKVEKTLEGVQKFFTGFEKRFGKTSLEMGEESPESGEKKDPFAKALRG